MHIAESRGLLAELSDFSQRHSTSSRPVLHISFHPSVHACIEWNYSKLPLLGSLFQRPTTANSNAPFKRATHDRCRCIAEGKEEGGRVHSLLFRLRDEEEEESKFVLPRNKSGVQHVTQKSVCLRLVMRLALAWRQILRGKLSCSFQCDRTPISGVMILPRCWVATLAKLG